MSKGFTFNQYSNKSTNLSTSSNAKVYDVSHSNSIVFKDNNGTEVGRLKFENGKVLFEGDVDASAKQFFETVIKDKVKNYIESYE